MRENETPKEMVDRVADKTNAWSAQNVADGGVCDFCCHLLGDRPVVTYTTTKPLVEEITVIGDGDWATLDHISDEYWAACPACDPVIQQKDPVVLAKHVTETADYDRIGAPSHPADLGRMTALYRRFFDAEPTRSEDPPPPLSDEDQVIADGMKRLVEVANLTEIFGFEYPDYPAAKAVHTRALETVDRLMESPDDDALGASVWVTKDPETQTRVFVMAADTGLGLREHCDWGDGVPYEATGRERASLLERHLGVGLEVAAGMRPERNEKHYGLGAELRGGNDLRIRVGGDQ